MDFIDTLKHTGDFVGEPFALRDWQQDIIRQIFDATGKARYRRVFIALPRKNGKTELIAAIALYLLLGTGKRGQNIYSASGDAEQAGLIHKAAATMIAQSESMSRICQVYQGNVKRIKVDPLGSEFKSLSSEAYSKFGLKPNVNLFDEVHVFPNGDLHTSLETAFGATKEPLTIYITTAGYDKTSLCHELWEQARAAKRDPASDPNFLGILYEPDEDDDWTNEETWKKVNPGLGDFVNITEFRDAFDTACRRPREENGFKQFRLNIWTSQAQRWINQEAWDECAYCLGDIPIRDLIGTPCYAGFDMGVTGDMSAFWVAWPIGNGLKVTGRCWAPKEGKWVDELRNKDRYTEWNREFAPGTNKRFLHFTPQNSMDEGAIREFIKTWNDHTPIISLFADRAYCTAMLNWLYNEAMIPVKGISQGPVSLNEACVALEELVLDHRIEHGANPILDWNVSNCSLHRGTTGLIHPDKSSATERIDALAALINAIAAWRADEENRSASVYEKPNQLWL